MIKNLSSYVSKSDIKPELACVLVKPDRMVATDSFRLVEVKGQTGIDKDTLIKLPKALKTLSAVTLKDEKLGTMEKGAWYELETIEGAFPRYETIMPTAEPIATIRVNAEYLKEIAQTFEDKKKLGFVDISFFGELKALRFTNKDESVTALLMPMAR